MVISPARAHFLKMMATKASTEAETGQVVTGSQYELMLMKLAQDKRRLKEIQSVERKVEVKKELLPEYYDWVDGAIKGNGAQDDVLVTVLVWMIDTGDFARALPCIEYALNHKLVLPEQYVRDLPTLVVDEVADSALSALQKAEPFDVDLLLKIEALTSGFDIPDQANAKLQKALGFAYQAKDDKEKALSYLQRADELNSKSGVRTTIRALKKDLGL